MENARPFSFIQNHLEPNETNDPIISSLVDIGYTAEQANIALQNVNPQTLENAILFLLDNPNLQQTNNSIVPNYSEYNSIEEYNHKDYDTIEDNPFYMPTEDVKVKQLTDYDMYKYEMEGIRKRTVNKKPNNDLQFFVNDMDVKVESKNVESEEKKILYSVDGKRIKKVVEELRDKIGREKGLSEDLLMKGEIYIESFQSMKDDLNTMIESNLDKPEILSDLLRINDRMEDTRIRYLKLKEESLIAVVDDGSANIAKKDISMNDSKPEKEIFIQIPEHDPTNTEPFECPICTDDVEIGKGFVIAKCRHSYCLDCLEGYLNVAIKNAQVLNIGCPHPGCGSKIEYHDVHKLVKPEVFEKYEEFSLLAALKEDPNTRWCPNPKGCGNAIIGDPAVTTKMVCGECNYNFCFLCNEEYHNGTCQEYQQWKVENGKADIKFSKWSQENTKPCPQCKVKIQKNSGCNHIKCLNCDYQFCWLCDQKYTSNHYDVYNILGCPGLQFRGGDSPKFGLGKSVGMKILVGSGIALGTAIALPLALVGGIVAAPVYGIYRLAKKD